MSNDNESGYINVFDEWGNFVGRVRPSGGGIDGVFFLLGLVSLGIIAFLVYLLIKLVISGFKALANRQWGMAVVRLIPIWVVLLVLLYAVGFVAFNSFEEAQATKYVVVENATWIECGNGAHEGTIKLDVVNRWDKPVHIASGGYFAPNGCGGLPATSFPSGGMSLKQGERITIYAYFNPDYGDEYCPVIMFVGVVGRVYLCPNLH